MTSPLASETGQLFDILQRLFKVENTLLVRLFKDSFRKQLNWYALAMIGMVVTAGMTAATAYIMREIVNGVVVDRDVAKTMMVAGMVAAIFIVKGTSTYFQSVFLSRAGNRIIADNQREVFDRIIRADLTFIQSRATSDLLLRVTHAAQAARNVIDTVVLSFVRDSLTIVGLVIVMIVQQPLLSMVALILGPLALAGTRFLISRVRKIMEMEMASLGEIIRVVQEATTGFRVVKSYGLEPMLKRDMDRSIGSVEQRANAIARIEAATSPLMETLAGIAIAGAIALSAIAVIQNGNTPGELVSFMTALLLTYEPAKRLARMRVQIEANMVGVRMLFEILDHPIELKEAPDAVDLPAGPGLIRLEQVGFSYRNGPKVLKDMDLSFEPGKVTALVGPSGAGKSTILNLIMRLYDPESGRVTIDGHDISKVTFKSLRRRISYVGQDPFLFAGTIRHNIAIGNEEASESEIVEAAKAASAHGFIMSLPNGYDTDVGENGRNLSGGQKQRITVARAFLRNSEILILDEATSSLDSESEAGIRKAIERLAHGRTTITIAHRLSTVAGADQIVVIEDGQVVEQGPPAELLRNDGAYRRLYTYQLLPDAGPLESLARAAGE
ncbi:ABC transporter ATP-binding protein [Aquibium carbonis]|uniref:ABC transporter ATP-binding protein n=1 Tax=Aquibium carbonis TaxID=2495581 RepID=A0A3S0A8L1_9HYPH|nr:ABC transporter ATP-binding protein [Aquibium carbonis]